MSKSQVNLSGIKHFPNLGKLGVAILESQVEKVIGKDARQLIKAPLEEKELREKLFDALQQTEKRFLEECHDHEVREALIALPFANLQSLQDAVRKFYDLPADSTLANQLLKQFALDFPNLPKDRVDAAVNIYLRIFKQELVALSEEVRSKLNAMATLEMSAHMGHMASTMDEIKDSVKLPKPSHPKSAGQRFAISSTSKKQGLPNELYKNCRDILIKCRVFEDQRSLRAVFASAELAPFRNELPDASSVMDRVDLFLGYIISKKYSNGSSVFPVFLEALRDRYDPSDALWNELDSLRAQVNKI